MLARSAFQATSNNTTCPFCQARKVPSATQMTQMKASTSTTEAMPVSKVAGVKPEPAWKAACLCRSHEPTSPPVIATQRRKGAGFRPRGIDVFLDPEANPLEILAQPVVLEANAGIRIGL